MWSCIVSSLVQVDYVILVCKNPNGILVYVLEWDFYLDGFEAVLAEKENECVVLTEGRGGNDDV